MQTAIYCRVSTEEQARDGFSIHAQKDKLTKYAEVNDWYIVDYYVDDGISGKNLSERPEVSRLIRDVKSGVVNNVLVYKLDRLTRSVKDLIYLIELFDENNCTFNSQTEKIDTSNAVGRMFVKIIGIFAEFERENLAERITFGYEQKTREGNYTNTNGVFGYDYLIGEGRIKVNKDESYYVKKIYEWYLEGDSMSKIARRLEDLNVPTKRGGKWSQSTISSILTNPLYIGIVRYGLHKKNNFEITGKSITPLIDRDLFYNVKNLIEKRFKFKTRKYSSDSTYYSKVLKCNKCGGRYHAKQQIQRGKTYVTYQCIGHCNNSCDAPGFSHNKLEASFLEFLDHVLDFEFTEELIGNRVDMIDHKEIEKLQKEVDQYNNKKHETTKLFSSDKINYDTFKQINEAVDKKLVLYYRELEMLKRKRKSMRVDSIGDIKNIIIHLKDNFIHLNNCEKKIFLERFVKEIKVEKVNNRVIIKNVEF